MVSQTRLEEIVASSKLVQDKIRKERLDREAKGLKPIPIRLLGRGRNAIREWELSEEQRSLQKKKRSLTCSLKAKYGLDFFIEKDVYPKVMNLLRQVDSGSRLNENDVIWLTTKDYFTDKLKQAFHSNEAKHFELLFKEGNDFWNAINASSHYRKSKAPKKADALLSEISNIAGLKKPNRLKAALWTTHGGAKRDLGDPRGALKLAMLAHNITPKSFMPCTLMGAIHMEQGDFDEGGAWYEKAIQRGFTDRKMDSEIRAIFNRASKEEKEKLKEYLLGIDPHRYRWVNGEKKPKRCGDSNLRAVGWLN